MKKKVLVTGGAGYIGGLTTDYLLDRGFDVAVYDNLLYEPRFLKDCRFIYGDIRDTKKLVRLQKDFDEIIWLAAIVGDGACAQNPELTTEVNVHSIKRFLDKTKRRIIFTSTCSVYGAQEGLLTERSRTAPLSLYAATKLQTEKHILAHRGLVFRLGTLFGMGDRYSRIRLDLVVNVLTLKAFRDGRLTIFGGNQWRPIISVRDVAEYLVEAVSREMVGVFNIKCRNIKIINLARKIKHIFPHIQIHATERKFEDLRNYRVDTSQADQHFIFRPRITVEEEVLRMKKVFEEKRIKNFDDDIYYNTHYVKSLLDKNGAI